MPNHSKSKLWMISLHVKQIKGNEFVDENCIIHKKNINVFAEGDCFPDYLHIPKADQTYKTHSSGQKRLPGCLRSIQQWLDSKDRKEQECIPSTQVLSWLPARRQGHPRPTPPQVQEPSKTRETTTYLCLRAGSSPLRQNWGLLVCK